MFDDLPSTDGSLEENQTPQIPAEPETPALAGASGWEKMWKRITSLGLGDIVMRAGTALVTIGLVGLVVWVMRGNFVGSEMVSDEAIPLEGAGGPIDSGEVVLPAYQGAAPVEGIGKTADLSTDAAAASRYEFIQYEVVSGDTLFGIADKFGLNPESILWTNLFTLWDNPAGLVPGQILKIPPEDGVLHTWSEGEGLNGVAKGLSVTPETIIDWPGNNLTYEMVGDFANPNIAPGTEIFAPGGRRGYRDFSTTIFARSETAESNVWGEGKCPPADSGPIGLGTFVWPAVETYISGFEFSPESNHWGIDVAGDLNDPLYAVDSGVVVYAGWNDWGYGNVVAIDHGNGFQSLYAHLESLNVGCLAYVTQGDVIGYMGSTGNSSGPHLHFELLSGDQRVNPHKYLPY
jgi:murein DD-endopeptidase MepM/ murein hydrolase activator NlpD